MIICIFAGHREIFECDIERHIEAAIEGILQKDSAFVFYSGEMGEFDRKCSAAVRNAKKHHPELDIRLIAVLPYMTSSINTNKDFYERSFDDVIIPTELANIHYKATIPKRNKWLVDHCDCLIAYVYHSFGGAYMTMKYAARHNKMIINIANLMKQP